MNRRSIQSEVIWRFKIILQLTVIINLRQMLFYVREKFIQRMLCLFPFMIMNRMRYIYEAT